MLAPTLRTLQEATRHESRAHIARARIMRRWLRGYSAPGGAPRGESLPLVLFTTIDAPPRVLGFYANGSIRQRIGPLTYAHKTLTDPHATRANEVRHHADALDLAANARASGDLHTAHEMLAIARASRQRLGAMLT